MLGRYRDLKGDRGWKGCMHGGRPCGCLLNILIEKGCISFWGIELDVCG